MRGEAQSASRFHVPSLGGVSSCVLYLVLAHARSR